MDTEQPLGLEVTPNPKGLAVLHYDTEQSEAQLHKNLGKTLRRASLTGVPDFYHSLYLASLSRKDRLKLIRESMDLFHHKHGGIHLVVIDGIADLIRSANDETESIAIVDELYRLAGIYNTCIICVLHFVPNGIKLRGHIGSELQRKAAGILSIEKYENPEYSVVKALKVRDGSPLDVPIIKNQKMNDTKTRALEYLEAHQEVKEIFATKDGFLFEKKYDALTHARTLNPDNPQVETFQRENEKSEDKPASENKEGQTGNLEQDNKNAEASDSLHENIES